MRHAIKARFHLFPSEDSHLHFLQVLPFFLAAAQVGQGGVCTSLGAMRAEDISQALMRQKSQPRGGLGTVQLALLGPARFFMTPSCAVKVSEQRQFDPGSASLINAGNYL